ncbi:preprotein translocase subunit SecE [Clostridium grantii]|jgi:preprotein translocase subunit SecE|uniref:Protein translocase subunit SecE n=1 Tax=Clostridium grantii DSM 8605 TaxID=1121316 RepID=A0A1M5XZP9_9CLOT|nr:preprotein translocase subunit SecE [Clostridium grantii]SHI05222.1 preprotein translocase subunit SecE [Clostridium grantii DSM 8605]
MAANEKIRKSQGLSSRGLFQFLRELKAETKRITWPTQEEVKKATIIVLVFCAVSAILIGMMDFVFSTLYKLIFK